MADEPVNPRKRKHESDPRSMEEHVQCIEKDVASIREDLDKLIPLVDSVDNLKTMVNSLQSSVDLILKPPYAKTPWYSSSSDDSSTDEYYQRDSLIASGLPPSITESAIKDFFAAVGEVEVELDAEEEENDKTATIRFASDEEAKEGLKLKGNDCLGSPMYLRRASNRLYTVYATGFDTSLPENEIKVQLIEHFSTTGDVKGLYFRKDNKGEIKGAYINRIDDSQNIALNVMNDGRKLTVESVTLRKAAKVEMKKNPVDPSMKPKSKKTVFTYDDNDELMEEN